MRIYHFIILLIICIFSNYIAYANNKIRISTSYKYPLSSPEQTGMLDLILKEAFRRIGYDAEIVFTPTERSLFDVNAGLLDGEINRIHGMEKLFSNIIQIPEPNMTMHFVAFSKKGYDTSGWESIRNLHIGLVKGWKILEKNTEGFPHVTKTPTDTELFRMLNLDRIDVALYDKLTGYEQLKLYGYDDVQHLEPPLASRDMFLYLHKSHADLVEPVAEALRSMKADGEYDRIVSASTNPRE